MRRQNDTVSNEGEGFWRFSLALYARPGVAEALLALQDGAGRNVNLLLFALWLGAVLGRRLDAPGLAAAEQALVPLEDAVGAPLRALRRQLRSAGAADAQALRRRIAALEIAAERHVQRRLVAASTAAPRGGPATDRLVAATANLALCLGGAVRPAESTVLHRALAALMRRG